MKKITIATLIAATATLATSVHSFCPSGTAAVEFPQIQRDVSGFVTSISNIAVCGRRMTAKFVAGDLAAIFGEPGVFMMSVAASESVNKRFSNPLLEVGAANASDALQDAIQHHGLSSHDFRFCQSNTLRCDLITPYGVWADASRLLTDYERASTPINPGTKLLLPVGSKIGDDGMGYVEWTAESGRLSRGPR